MRSKEQIAQSEYGKSLTRLSTGQKAHVGRLYSSQSQSAPVEPVQTREPGCFSVKFGRPSINGVKEIWVRANEGKTFQDALNQAQVQIVPSKEGLKDRDTTAIIKFADLVVKDTNVFIAPGIDSN